jgi:DNA-binding GntR family transcriptional regulator
MVTRADAIERRPSKVASSFDEQIDAKSSPDTVFDEILAGLYDGRYAPGQRLIESDLTRRYKVSRGSVREALRRLASEGFVKITLHRGAYVRSLNRTEARHALMLLEVLIGLAARLAAENIHVPDSASRMKAALGELIAPKQNRAYGEVIRARHGFYTTMVAVGENEELARLLKSMELVRIQFRTHPTADEIRVENYRRITDAILSGKGAQAEKVARAHIREFLKRIEDLPENAFPVDV